MVRRSRDLGFTNGFACVPTTDM